jgi:hypothetical protein
MASIVELEGTLADLDIQIERLTAQRKQVELSYRSHPDRLLEYVNKAVSVLEALTEKHKTAIDIEGKRRSLESNLQSIPITKVEEFNEGGEAGWTGNTISYRWAGEEIVYSIWSDPWSSIFTAVCVYGEADYARVYKLCRKARKTGDLSELEDKYLPILYSYLGKGLKYPEYDDEDDYDEDDYDEDDYDEE